MFAEMQRNAIITPDKRRGSSIKQARGSFLKGSFIGFEDVPVETEEQRREREMKELMDKFQVLSKEDAQKEYAKKDFGEFLAKTSRIMERALDQEFDVIADFFADDDDENEKKKVVKGEKITQQFVFQPNIQVKRAVTCMDWSPKVSIVAFAVISFIANLSILL